MTSTAKLYDIYNPTGSPDVVHSIEHTLRVGPGERLQRFRQGRRMDQAQVQLGLADARRGEYGPDAGAAEHPATPAPIAAVVGELHRVHRPDLDADALQRKHRGRIADMTVSDMRLNRQDVHRRGSSGTVTAGLGLMLMLRWAWALTLAAVLLLAAVFFWRFSAGHQLPYIVQGLLNLVFFFYLVRAEVREKLR